MGGVRVLLEYYLRQGVVRFGEVEGLLFCPEEVHVPAELQVCGGAVRLAARGAVSDLQLQGRELEVEAVFLRRDFRDVLLDGAVGQVLCDDGPEQQQDHRSPDQVRPGVHRLVVGQKETPQHVSEFPEVLPVAGQQVLVVDQERGRVLDVDDLRQPIFARGRVAGLRLRAAGRCRNLISFRALVLHPLRSKLLINI